MKATNLPSDEIAASTLSKSVTRAKCAFSSGLAGAGCGRTISQTAVPISSAAATTHGSHARFDIDFGCDPLVAAAVSADVPIDVPGEVPADAPLSDSMANPRSLAD